jgi:hypothetical protein
VTIAAAIGLIAAMVFFGGAKNWYTKSFATTAAVPTLLVVAANTAIIGLAHSWLSAIAGFVSAQIVAGLILGTWGRNLRGIEFIPVVGAASLVATTVAVILALTA